MNRSLAVRRLTRDEWYRHADCFGDLCYRQLHDYNEHAAARMSTSVEHVAVERDGELVGLAGVRCRRVPLLATGIAYVGGGPLTRRGEHTDLAELEACLRGLRAEYAERRGLALRIAPPLAVPGEADAVAGVYHSLGFAEQVQGDRYRTILLDISPEPDALRASLSSRWRRQLRKSEKFDVRVDCGTSVELFREFCDLFDAFIDWKGFTVDIEPRFHLAVHEQFPESARYLITVARHEGEIVGGLVCGLHGDMPVYILGATHPGKRDLRVGHYLHWNMMLRLRERGHRWYDLGGIDPVANPGGYEFKEGTGGLDVTAPGPFEYGAQGIAGRFLRVAERSYRSLQRLRKRIRG